MIKEKTIMKQTVMTISMINNNVNINGEQRMTSLEIAQLTGKQHKNVMRDIRNMEPAWEKIAGLKFELGSYEDINGQLRPCYLLSKTECLYIATKFNDEARAKLVLRWEELEQDVRCKMEEERCKMEEGRCKRPQEIRLLACDEEVLNEADEIIGEELDALNQFSDHCYTPSDIGKVFGLDGRDLNSFLADQKVIRWACGQWHLTKKYENRGLTENRCFIYHGRNGRRKMASRLVWTEKGREFVLDLIRG
jgi:phage regulator Rha-like protein